MTVSVSEDKETRREETRRSKVKGVNVVTVPAVHTPVVLSYVPWLGVADTNAGYIGEQVFQGGGPSGWGSSSGISAAEDA